MSGECSKKVFSLKKERFLQTFQGIQTLHMHPMDGKVTAIGSGRAELQVSIKAIDPLKKPVFSFTR
jgi:hypothetical protein